VLLPMKRCLTTASVTLAVVLLFRCTDAQIQPITGQLSNADNKLTLKGRVCSPVPDPSGFPVKVVFVVDQSGSMCVSDPPGSQNGQGFCERADILAIVPPGITEPARVRAIRRLLADFAPNVRVSVVPFETNVQAPWPPTTSGQRFGRADDPTIGPYLSRLQATLGKGTDYQGAFAYVQTLIQSDMDAVSRRNPSELPRTRYVVVFLTDGTPYPRCTQNHNLPQYADPDHPWLIWPDSEGAEDFCAGLNVGDPITGYIYGTDRNQNYQIFKYVDLLLALKQQYNVGDVRVHTVNIFNKAAVDACGPICQDLYGAFPNVPQSQYADKAFQVAEWILKQIAQRGNGIYQAFIDSNIQNLGLGGLDYTSLVSPYALKSLIAQNQRAVAVPGPHGDFFAPDSDGDGISDDDEFNYGTNKFFDDSDSDCFNDRFEVLHKDQGFDPLVKDPRGCDPNNPATLGCACRDTDGDGLSQYAEAYLGTNTNLVDTDGDGIPDGIEVRYRMDPLNPDDANFDTDGDGISNIREIRANTNPNRKDKDLFDRDGYLYSTTAVPQPDGSICYDFSISNATLVTPPSQAGVREGFNLFKIWVAFSPQSGVATDNGDWKAACAWAQYDKPLRDPVGPELTFTDSNFHLPNQLVLPGDYLGGNCVGRAP